MAYSLMADCARIKWYMRLASRFIRAMVLQMRMAPWRRSALWDDVRPEGTDFVRRCRKVPAGLVLGFLDEAVPVWLVEAISARRIVVSPVVLATPVT
jgi:hypothetical protein